MVEPCQLLPIRIGYALLGKGGGKSAPYESVRGLAQAPFLMSVNSEAAGGGNSLGQLGPRGGAAFQLGDGAWVEGTGSNLLRTSAISPGLKP